MGLEAVELDEAARVEELVDALARGQLALGLALGEALLAAAEQRLAVRSSPPPSSASRFRRSSSARFSLIPMSSRAKRDP